MHTLLCAACRAPIDGEPQRIKGNAVCKRCYAKALERAKAKKSSSAAQVSAPPNPPAARGVAVIEPETCSNCGASIGRMETPRIFNGAIVCAPCEAKLLPPVRVETAKEPERLIQEGRLSRFWIFFCIPFALVIVGIPFLLLAVLGWLSSSYRLTSRRITISRGLLVKSNFDMLLTKIESVDVQLGLIGGAFGVGAITVYGVGGRRERFPAFPRAAAFRETLTEAISATER